MNSQELTSLLQIVNSLEDEDRALEELNHAAMRITASRNGLIAQMNEEEGVLEVIHGDGPDWTESLYEERIAVTTRSGFVSYVAATGQPLRTGDVSHETHYVQMYASTKSEAAVPIRNRHGRIEAVLNVESDRPDHYSDSHLADMAVLAELIAMVIDRADAKRREDALVEIGHALDSALSEEEVVRGVLRIADEFLRFQAFGVFVLDATSQNYVLRGAIGRLRDRIGALTIEPGHGITGWVAKTGKPWLTHDPTNDPRWTAANNEFPDDQIASFLAVPVVSRGRCVGILRVIRKHSENRHLDNRFTNDDVRVLSAIAEQMATSLESQRAVRKLVHSERMAAWGELSAKSSHMIGNRVFALKGDVNELGHVLSAESLARQSLEELHDSLVKNVLRIEEILQDFRDFVTATQLDQQPLNLNELVEETAREIFPRRSAVELVFDLEPSLPPIPLDGRRMRRAISELIENSMNYVDQGQLRVTTGWAQENDLRRAKLPVEKNFVRITVHDTGPGVDPDRKEKIFQPFFSGRVKGMGLGLSIVKGIADAHGGAIFEAGELGYGAKFVILLPVADRS